MKGKEKKQNENFEKETSELSIEELTDVQGGIEDTDSDEKDSCGLGCFLGQVGGNENK